MAKTQNVKQKQYHNTFSKYIKNGRHQKKKKNKPLKISNGFIIKWHWRHSGKQVEGGVALREQRLATKALTCTPEERCWWPETRQKARRMVETSGHAQKRPRC